MSRRPPAAFLTATLTGREWLTSRLVRVTLEGPELTGPRVTEPASSIRVLLPEPGRSGPLEMPDWDGNRFVYPGGRRPTIRTLTPRRHQPEPGVLQVDVVVHGAGAAALWAATAAEGTPAAVSGPARGYSLDPEATRLVLGGDETAVAAISQIVETSPGDLELDVHVETGAADARPPLPSHPRSRIRWVTTDGRLPGQALVEQLADVEIPEGTRMWVAGEAAAMQRLRQRTFTERGVPRSRVTIRGYWKHGRSAEAGAG